MIRTVGISRWHAGEAEADAATAELDEGLQQTGFVLVTGYGIDPGLAAQVRAAAREFFALPDAVKRLCRRHRNPAGPQGEPQPGR